MRLEARFDARRRAGRTTLVMYLAASDPDEGATLAFMRDLVAAGVDVIELGYPFSDPILDGPIIQRANRRALDAGGSLLATLRVVAQFRRTDQATPIVLMGYYHPIVALGLPRFIEAADGAGIDGLIVPDLPLDHARKDLLPLMDGVGFKLVPLSAPMLQAADIVDDAAAMGGFIYCIAAAGPTGGATPSQEAIALQVARCRTFTTLPVAVGFGIKTPADALAVAREADGVVVASVLVDQIAAWVAEGVPARALSTRIRAYAADFRSTLDQWSSTRPSNRGRVESETASSRTTSTG